jgi:hypothetical protein
LKATKEVLNALWGMAPNEAAYSIHQDGKTYLLRKQPGWNARDGRWVFQPEDVVWSGHYA